MKTQRKRVKIIRTRECTVKVISQRGKPDVIRIMAERTTVLEVGIQGVRSPTPMKTFDRPQLDWKSLSRITG